MNTKNMNREHLLNVLMEYIKENEELRIENEDLRESLVIANQNADEISKIAMALIEKNKVYDALNNSATDYFNECEKYKDAIIEYAIHKADIIIKEAEAKAAKMTDGKTI